MAKSEQLQIRIAPAQKAMLRRLARAAGLDVSSYVLARALPEQAERFTRLARAVGNDADRTYAFAALNDFLTDLAPMQFGEAVAPAPPADLSPWVANYVAALVEQAAMLKRVPTPAWARDVPPLDAPWFATPLASLRAYLVRAAPVAFKRRNLFADAGIGSRV